jgi:O-antigen ligase
MKFTPMTAERAAMRVVQAGAIAVVLAALPYKTFDLDRYFVPKELVLHITATIAAIACVVWRRRIVPSLVDWLLVAFLVLSLASAVAATNWWLAWRGFAISLSGAALFWVARALHQAGYTRAVVWALAVAAVLGAVTALAQAYGFESPYFSLTRSPGGTFGNRNFMAHLGAIAAPVLVLCAVSARRSVGFLLGAVGLGVIAASQVLSRSRAAWLALAVSLGVVALGAWTTRRRWREPRTRRRLEGLLGGAAIGAAAAILVPNTLEWKSDSPYLDSVRGVVNYKKGSGKGRLVQYSTSLRITAAHPLLGVGPGNWAVAYPRYASPGDPSLDSQGMTANPWPSSDWMAIVSERGVPASIALVVVLLGIAVNGIRQLRDARTAEQLFSALALCGTIVATLIVGAFDAVLLLALPTMFVWTLLGALIEPRPRERRVGTTRGTSQWAPVVIFALGILAVGRTALQWAAMAVYSDSSRTTAIERAARLDPGNYRIHIRLAEAYFARGDCSGARAQAQIARRLYPNAPRPKEYLAACGGGVRARGA